MDCWKGIKMYFRDLRADEVECRVATCKPDGCILLLYKDARCDMNILDETVGIMGWKRHHEVIAGNLFCTVELYDADKGEWISKQDVGKESRAEREKGQASDSFKRACFNLGIGRELYTAPLIWLGPANVNIFEERGKYGTRDNFQVSKMEVKDKKITKLEIKNQKTKKVVFSWDFGSETGQEERTLEPAGKKKISKKKQKSLLEFCDEKHLDIGKILDSYSLKDISELNENQHATIIRVHDRYLEEWGVD